MSNKIALIYDEGNYTILVNGNIEKVEKDLDEAVSKYKELIQANIVTQANSWENIEKKAKSFNNVEVNSEYKTVSFGNMKYFYNTNKIFYIADGMMSPLLGGFYLFSFIMELVELKLCDNYEDILRLCKFVVEKKATYRVNESILAVGSPAFNYGSAEYNFTTKKIHKGASVDKGSFKDFERYVLDIIG